MPIRFHERSSHSGDAVSDGNYFYDAEGNVTQDEAKGVRWLAREGANVLPEHRDALKAFQESSPKGKVAQSEGEAEDGTVEPKAAKPSANKRATASKNKGAK